jgi:hypothetical protein
MFSNRTRAGLCLAVLIAAITVLAAAAPPPSYGAPRQSVDSATATLSAVHEPADRAGAASSVVPLVVLTAGTVCLWLVHRARRRRNA